MNAPSKLTPRRQMRDAEKAKMHRINILLSTVGILAIGLLFFTIASAVLLTYNVK